MRSPNHSTSPSSSPLDNAFAPAYLARLREQDEAITAAEAELAGPWKIEPIPGKPGAVAVLRQWEDLAAGDRPVAVVWHEELALLLSVLFPAPEAVGPFPPRPCHNARPCTPSSSNSPGTASPSSSATSSWSGSASPSRPCRR